jgi:hypothetical protein
VSADRQIHQVLLGFVDALTGQGGEFSVPPAPVPGKASAARPATFSRLFGDSWRLAHAAHRDTKSDPCAVP